MLVFFQLKCEIKEDSSEVSFPPGLDRVMGVSNNKQHALNFKNKQIEEEADRENLSVEELKDEWKSTNDPNLHTYTIISRVTSVIKTLENSLKSLDFGNIKKNTTSGESIVDKIATEGSKIRDSEGNTPKDGVKTPTIDDIIDVLKPGAHDIEPSEIDTKKLKYHIESIPFDSKAFFDVTRKNGFTLVQVNKRHAFYTKIMDEMSDKQKSILELTLAAWARMEDEAGDVVAPQYENARRNWGEVLTTFLSLDDE